MSELTKVWLLTTIAELEEERDATPGAVNEDSAMALAAMKLALASLEAEAVAEVCEGFTLRYIGHGPAPKSGVHIGDRLYTAPPAPVSVPDEVNVLLNHLEDVLPDEAFNLIDVKTWNNVSMLSRPDVYRAAMFQGAETVQGWIPCSERMPSAGEKVLAYRPDAPESNDPLIKMATYVGGSAHGHGFDCYCKPTHWMPLPAAPQQEDNNG
ncbi:DUF551 domain-containing protein [Enterobacter hormaechei]|uniref:DUF551 domain-containing protein n=1 Tax=Enterobacter hormaechei TaxID=158836 RepID=UPI00197AD9FD|nr:DUF551 domain-containing protein [Enterobacter hormaechei]